jgi:hypothetical protein
MHRGARDITRCEARSAVARRGSFLSLCALSSPEASCLRALHTDRNRATQAQNGARNAAGRRGLPSAPLTPLKGRIPDKPSETKIQVRSSLLYRAGDGQVKRKNKKIRSRGNHPGSHLSRAQGTKTPGPARRVQALDLPFSASRHVPAGGVLLAGRQDGLAVPKRIISRLGSRSPCRIGCHRCTACRPRPASDWPCRRRRR